MEDCFIMKKKIDKSVLCQGFAIPADFQGVFYERTGYTLGRGEKVPLTVMMDGVTYTVKLINQSFDENKYTGHTDLLQIRYDSNKLFIGALRAKFAKTWDALCAYHAEKKTYKGFSAPPEETEYVVLYATTVKGTICFDCIAEEDYTANATALRGISEQTFENMTDETAYVETTVGIRKIRHLSKTIGNSLKVLYGYRCQICGEFIGEKYGSTLIHAHHIDYFTKSLNNNTDNIMIVCPNHHAVIHDCNPAFDRVSKTFLYPNGYREGLKLNKHI